MTLQEKIARYREVRDAGAQWLLSLMNPDGSLGDPEEGFRFYRAPWTFALVGETEAAAAICGWIRREMLTPDGKIDGPYRKLYDGYAYRNATLITGAHHAGQLDLSFGLIDELAEWQDPLSGGVSNDRLADGSRSDDMDIPYACGPGFAFLATGQIERARAVAGFLKRIYEAQTELPARFLYAWSIAQQSIITEFTEAQKTGRVVENQLAAKQRWTIGGISAGFLCRLYLADPNPDYIALARKYQAFSMAATERQFDYPQCCKSSWGSSLLYQVTGDEIYRDWTIKMGDWYARTQQEDGKWAWPTYTELGTQVELTLEFVMHVDTIISGLSSRL